MNEAVRTAALRLAAAQIENAEREAAWMLAALLGVRRGDLMGRRLNLSEQAAFDALIERRLRREPLQYIIGTEEFLGLDLEVTPAVLIPRPETEVLVKQADFRLRRRSDVADIGTGSGAIAIALAVRGHRVWATDLSADALAVAERNVRKHRAAIDAAGGAVHLRQGDLVEPLRGLAFDAVLSNPPYVADRELRALQPEVRDWEPRMALVTGTDDPLHYYRRMAAEATPLIRPGGILGVEVGAGQAEAVEELFVQAGLTRVSRHRDHQGYERTLVAETATS
jgi:release factor glutamine methyltransferase